MIGSLRDLGKTIFLTTHYMEEAQALADRAAILGGRADRRRGPPDQLGGRDGAEAIRSASGCRRERTRRICPPPFASEPRIGGPEVSLHQDDPLPTCGR